MSKRFVAFIFGGNEQKEVEEFELVKNFTNRLVARGRGV
jgi:hypothetical protein